MTTIENGLIVKNSLIPSAGLGLFATRIFKRREHLTQYDGETLTRQEARNRPLQTHMASRDGVTIDGLKVPIATLGGGSFANGSPLARKSNAKIVAKLGTLQVYCTKDILPGDEVIIHYGRRGFEIACGHEKLSN